MKAQNYGKNNSKQNGNINVLWFDEGNNMKGHKVYKNQYTDNNKVNQENNTSFYNKYKHIIVKHNNKFWQFFHTFGIKIIQNNQNSTTNSKFHNKKYILNNHTNLDTDLPIVPIKIGNTSTNAIIDSGATLSVATQSLYQRLKQEKIKMNYNSRQVSIFAFNDSPINFTANIDFIFQINDSKFKHNFLSHEITTKISKSFWDMIS